MEILGVIEMAADMLVEMKGVLGVTMAGLPVGDLILGASVAKDGNIKSQNTHHH